MGVKKLKKIPSDLVPYIAAEGEAIKDNGDRTIIVSYATSNLETIDWYIRLIDSGSKNYAIPHSREHLTDIKNLILAEVKKIMDRPIPAPKNAKNKWMGFDYPPGYDG
jgi:hypothetical protein